jgi:hypothetical protein
MQAAPLTLLPQPRRSPSELLGVVPPPCPLGKLLHELVRESGARALLITDDAGMLVEAAGAFDSRAAETVAVLAVNASEAGRQTALLAGLGEPADFWQRADGGGYGVLPLGRRHRLVAIHGSCRAEGAVAFALRAKQAELTGLLEARQNLAVPPALADSELPAHGPFGGGNLTWTRRIPG